MASTSGSGVQSAECFGTWAVNVSNFVSEKLHIDEFSTNYIVWREQMLCLIESQGLIGLINGEVAPEQDVVWRRNDRLVKGWILGALTYQLAEKCIKFGTAREVWLKLDRKFTKSKISPRPPEEEHFKYLDLYKAALRGDWDTARGILEQDGEAAKARLLFTLETALHIAVGTGKAIHFVENLVQKLTVEELEVRDRHGRTALHTAAITGNTAAARILVDRHPPMLYMTGEAGWFPVHDAARSAHRDTLEFLLLRTTEPPPYDEYKGAILLCMIIDADFYDIALRLVNDYPHMAGRKPGSTASALHRLSLKKMAFLSGAGFNFWEHLIYSCIDLLERESEATPQSIDIEDPSPCTAVVLGLHKKLKQYLLVVIDKLVPLGRKTRTKKLMHQQALQLLKCLCRNLIPLGINEASPIYVSATMTAASLEIPEVIQEIAETIPDALYSTRMGHFFFQIAAINRCEQVFNLIYQTKDHKHKYSDLKDSSKNTVLHLVAKLAPPHKLSLVSGAALQMQRELQWFKEVENFVHPYARKLENGDRKTPRMIFTEEHKNLKAEGEKWMKETASSYIIVAALIATVVFAAAITVPGGNKSTGYPVFTESPAFIVFAISDAASLFASITSLLMFLSIMTSRYAEDDFLYALPKRLCIGLFTLFVSIIFMMVAFSAATHLVLGQEKRWVLGPVVALACLPIASFVLLQFPLLWDVISSTYFCRIFGKQTDHGPFFY
ncbi:hypothetical protein ACS0TY_030304 [Phlomoides rotata]